MMGVLTLGLAAAGDEFSGSRHRRRGDDRACDQRDSANSTLELICTTREIEEMDERWKSIKIREGRGRGVLTMLHTNSSDGGKLRQEVRDVDPWSWIGSTTSSLYLGDYHEEFLEVLWLDEIIKRIKEMNNKEKISPIVAVMPRRRNQRHNILQLIMWFHFVGEEGEGVGAAAMGKGEKECVMEPTNL